MQGMSRTLIASLAGIGGFIMANSMKVVKDTGKALGEAFRHKVPKEREYLDTLGVLYSLMRDLRTPFGGMGQSGLGRRHGAEGLRKYTEEQNVTVQRGLTLAGPEGVDQERWTGFLAGALKAAKWGGLR